MFRYKQSWGLTTLLVLVWVMCIIPVNCDCIFAGVVKVIYFGNWSILQEACTSQVILPYKKCMQETSMVWKWKLFWALDLAQSNFILV